jgi:hypothetical protein
MEIKMKIFKKEILVIAMSFSCVAAFAENANLSGNCNVIEGGAKFCHLEYNNAKIQYTVPSSGPLAQSTITLFVGQEGQADGKPTCDLSTAVMSTVLKSSDKKASFSSDADSKAKIKKIFDHQMKWCAGAVVDTTADGKPVKCDFWHRGSSFETNSLTQNCTVVKMGDDNSSCSFSVTQCK